MEYEVGSAAFIVPRIGEHISNGLNSLRENFKYADSHPANDPSICSPIFQTVNESFPDDLITFHHQEEVVATNESQDATSTSMFDLHDIDRSDLFSFDIDDIGPSLPLVSPALDYLSSAFDFKPESDFADISLPDNLVDLIEERHPEFSSVQIPDNASFTNTSSEEQVWNNFNTEGTSLSLSDVEFEEDGVGEFMEVKPLIARKSRQKSNQNNSTLCLHNEDLAHGKPGQRLILTAEERRLLAQMGQRIPSHFPLTRSEERAIRTMRRKIRNKLSAKASRARRQEYVSCLESQVTDCQKENQRLKNRIKKLEEDKEGLLANLHNTRSALNKLLKGTFTATANGFGLSSSYTSKLQPLLPLTVPRQAGNANQSRKAMMKSSKPASLLLVALMILASATVLPLPGLENNPEASAALKSDEASNILSGVEHVVLKVHELGADSQPPNASVLTVNISQNRELIFDVIKRLKSLEPPESRSRLLLNQDDEHSLKMHVKSEPQQDPASIVRSLENPDNDDDDDGIPVIKTKINILNRSAKGRPLVLQTLKEDEQFDPFILPSNLEKNTNEKTLVVGKKLLERETHKKSPPIPYSVEDL